MATDLIEDALFDWGEYAEARKRLRDRGYCRSNRDPEAEFAEWLVAHLLPEGELVKSPVQPDYDVVAGNRRIQVRKYGKATGNKAPMAPKLQPDLEKRPTHYAFVEFRGGLPVAVYVCTYEWVEQNSQRSGGLRIETVREASARLEAGIETYLIPVGRDRADAEARLAQAQAAGLVEWSGKRLAPAEPPIEPSGEGEMSALLLSQRR